MTTFLLLASIPSEIIGLWLLIEYGRRWRASLLVAIPLMLFAPVLIVAYASTFLGYATDAVLATQFRLIYAQADDATHTVTALVLLDGDTRPRLYAITGDYEKTKKAFAQAQSKVAKGVPMAGRKEKGTGEDEGSYVLYSLPPAGLSQKDAS